ncbi:DUF2330 domain-containing protein [Patescibacteria group bacterium]|nr:DUF2330 domain-containing protein [Patescibacteria group bacterium]
MKKLLIAIFVFCSLASVALADGFVVADYAAFLTVPEQKAVVEWDGVTEELTIASKVSADGLGNFAWIVPVVSASEPVVEEGSLDLFYEMADLFMERELEKSYLGGSSFETSSLSRTVTVVEEKKIDIYDVAVLKAEKVDDLLAWLNENGYEIGDEALPVLEKYLEMENVYFIANKINLENEYAGFLPVTAAENECVKLAIPEIGDDYYDIYKYGWIFADIEECADAQLELVDALIKLERGMSTPLKISFEPPRAFYPMQISSINGGQSIVDVYVVADEPVIDESGLLELKQMTEYYQDFVTFLSFEGGLAEMGADSWFVESSYDELLDPNGPDNWGYVGHGEREQWYYWWEDIKYFLWYTAMPVSILIFAIVGFVVVVRALVKIIRK